MWTVREEAEASTGAFGWTDFTRDPAAARRGVCMSMTTQIQSPGYFVKTELLETTGWRESLTWVHIWLGENYKKSASSFRVDLQPTGKEGEQVREEFRRSLLNARVWRGQRIITAPCLAFLPHHHLFRLKVPHLAHYCLLSHTYVLYRTKRKGKFKCFSHNFKTALNQGSPSTATSPQPVRNEATQQEVSRGPVSEASFATPHGSPLLALPPEPCTLPLICGKTVFHKPVPGAKKTTALNDQDLVCSS